MNLLIVDDEALSVDGIAAALPWDTLQISHVFKAYSMQQAKDVFSKHTVDILLCDIEMPQGSGIDLMKWIRTMRYTPICIFLTSYSKFEYATSAVKLQMFDYVLKPCEYSTLEKIIEKAVQKRLEETAREENEKLGTLWTQDYQNRLHSFWNDLFQGDISSEEKMLFHEIEWRHLNPEMMHQNYYILMLNLLPHKEMNGWQDNSWRYAVKNIIAEFLTAEIVLTWEQTFIAVVSVVHTPDFTHFTDLCRDLSKTLRQYIPAESLGYLSPPCSIPHAKSTLQKLRQDAREKYALQSTIFVLGQTYTPRADPSFSTERWINSLLAHNPIIIPNDIRHYLTRPVPDQYIDRNLLVLIYHQLLKVVFDVLEIHSTDSQLSQDAVPDSQTDFLKSVPDFLLWAQHITEETIQHISQNTSSSPAVDSVIRYIHENLSCDLTRNELTKVAHLHPDYLSSVFRQRTGLPLSEYITRERIAEAKRLLLSTDLPVNEIALRTGFQTIPYFSRQFKHYAKMTPLQYRKAMKLPGTIR